MYFIKGRRNISFQEVKDLRVLTRGLQSSISKLGDETREYFLLYSIFSSLESMTWVLNELYTEASSREEGKKYK